MKSIKILVILFLMTGCSMHQSEPQEKFSLETKTLKNEQIFSKKSEQKLEEEKLSYKPNFKLSKAFQQTFEQKFTIHCLVPNKITSKEGIQLNISPETFVDSEGKIVSGDVDVSIQEAFSSKDMITSNLTTLSDGKILISGGMFNLKVSQNGKDLKIAKGKNIQTSVPCTDKEMKIFKGETNSSGELNWVLVNDQVKPSFEVVNKSYRNDLESMFDVFGFNFPNKSDQNVYIRWELDPVQVAKEKNLEKIYAEIQKVKRQNKQKQMQFIQDSVQLSFVNEMSKLFPKIDPKQIKFRSLVWKNEFALKKLGLNKNDEVLDLVLKNHLQLFENLQKNDSLTQVFNEQIQFKIQNLENQILTTEHDFENRRIENLNNIRMFRVYDKSKIYSHVQERCYPENNWTYMEIHSEKMIRSVLNNLLSYKELPISHRAIGLQKVKVIVKKKSYQKTLKEKLALVKKLNITRQEFSKLRQEKSKTNQTLNFKIEELGHYNLDKFSQDEMIAFSGQLPVDKNHQHSEIYLVGEQVKIVLKAKKDQNGKFSFNFSKNQPFIVIVMNQEYGIQIKKFKGIEHQKLGSFVLEKKNKIEMDQILEDNLPS